MLSYAWGDLFDQTNRATRAYTYRDKDNKITAEKLGVYPEFNTTGTTRESIQALKKALATIKFLNDQHNAKIEYLWMDQMCINQFDNGEKEHEVPKMRQYYSNASTTLIAIDVEIGEIDKNNEVWLIGYPISKIVKSPWFHCSWTFQEGILSKQTIFMFGDYLVDGRILAQCWVNNNFNNFDIPYEYVIADVTYNPIIHVTPSRLVLL